MAVTACHAARWALEEQRRLDMGEAGGGVDDTATGGEVV